MTTLASRVALSAVVLSAWLVLPARAQDDPSRPGPPNGADGRPSEGGANSGQPTSRQQVPLTPQPKTLGAPFKISKEQYEYLFQVLKAWETHTAKIDLLRSEVTLWRYDKTFGNKKENYLKDVLTGELKFAAPDKAVYKIKDKDGNWIEDWMCDGKALFEFRHDAKQVIQRTVPPDMRGKAIAEGPLPFFFGAKAERIIDRYYMRVVTPQENLKTEVWLEAYPKHHQDAANFQRVTIILRRDTMLPFAVETYLPGGNEKTTHRFDDVKIGKGLLEGVFGGDDFEPYVPRGWVKVVDPERNPAPRVGNRPASKQPGASQRTMR